MRGIVGASLIAFVLTTPARGQSPVPYRDVEAECGAFARQHAKPVEMKRVCIEVEMQNKKTLTPMWRSAPETVRRACAGAKTYGVLGYCLSTKGRPSGAPSLPEWNMRQFCASRFRTPDTSECVNVQNEIRQRLRQQWSNFSTLDKEECLAADDGLPSYVQLYACLDARKRSQ